MSGNCQIPTPIEYAKEMLDYAGYQSNLYGKRVLENSCGEGNILCEIVRRYIEDATASGYSKAAIAAGLEYDIEAYEVDNRKVDVCTANLKDILKEYDINEVRWNIHNTDYLKDGIKRYSYIIGNPPYITYHDMEKKQRKYLKKKYASCREGRFDYCYAFIEKSLESLERGGILVYLVPYSVIRNKFGSELRKIILPYLEEIYDYTGIKIFPEAITSSIIMKCINQDNGEDIRYVSVKDGLDLKYKRSILDDKWSFEEETEKDRRFGDYFEVCNSVATLLNEAFLLENYEESEHYILSKGCKIEKEIVYPAISTKSINRNKKLLIIFPYIYKNGIVRHFDEEEFQRMFPGASMYLNRYRDKLDKRKKDKKAKWFEYGRSQALARTFGRKLVMPMVITNSVNIHEGERKAIPYAGYFIKCRRGSDLQLKDAKRILESQDFLEYVMRRGTPTTPTSYRISVNDIKEYKF